MAFRLKLGKQSNISLIIKDHVIRLAEVKSHGDLHIQRLEERFIPSGLIKEGRIQDSETLIAILEECVNEWKLKNKQVTFLVPDPFIVMRKIAIPADVHEDELKGYLFMEIGATIHLPFEDPIFDYYSLPQQNNERKEVLLFAAPESVVAEYTDILEEVKLKPAAADLSALSLYRLYHKLDMANADENLMLVQYDLTTVNVSIFENHIPIIMRHLKLDIDASQWDTVRSENGGRKLHYSGSANDVGSSLMDSYKEIDRVQDYYQFSLTQGKKKITKIVVDGDHPYLDDIFKEMKNRYSVPVLTLKNDVIDSGQYAELPSFYLNIGLALKEV
ncbi:type IV pilus biogenesis protein PilM [Cytobacillus gottheilii]|uniref:Pilus assembly protein PilM n=1 Tax=Cytobacillus gottheilii TaxID=859144 RepID=A0ABX8F887_9BACI|nr:pilus assembly protein PilM [Cytobacillus gottheilii]QVY60541.1 pilus assembly protein PilM [Cytobacillus gottheilii]